MQTGHLGPVAPKRTKLEAPIMWVCRYIPGLTGLSRYMFGPGVTCAYSLLYLGYVEALTGIVNAQLDNEI